MGNVKIAEGPQQRGPARERGPGETDLSIEPPRDYFPQHAALLEQQPQSPQQPASQQPLPQSAQHAPPAQHAQSPQQPALQQPAPQPQSTQEHEAPQQHGAAETFATGAGDDMSPAEARQSTAMVLINMERSF
jgi:hypothetical protein